MINFIVGGIIVVAVGLALAYIIRSRKNGVKCIGCPDAGSCHMNSHAGNSSAGCSSCGGCTGHTEKE